MLFSPEDAPATIAHIVDDISPYTSGKSIEDLIQFVSQKLQSADRDGDQEMLDADDPYEEDSDGYSGYGSDDADALFPDEEMAPDPSGRRGSSTLPAAKHATAAFRQRVRRDGRIVKDAGFRVGHVGGLLEGHNCYVSLSCRISKLGISEEAMKAWHVEPSEYFVVIIHYPYGYKSIEDYLKLRDAPTARRSFDVRIGVSTSYRPTNREAVDAFAVFNKEMEPRRDASPPTDPEVLDNSTKGFRPCFISRPLIELMDERFYSLLCSRYEHRKLSWDGAEAFYNDSLGATTSAGTPNKKHFKKEQSSHEYPPIVTADHLAPTKKGDWNEHSLPLATMQFVLRHFVRCTEFCLVCFTPLPNDIQALKPYVCDKPLCLYQYMSLGFGPSIEHEILSQPKVVDLLICFCYASARHRKLTDFPFGLGLMVPPVESYPPTGSREIFPGGIPGAPKTGPQARTATDIAAVAPPVQVQPISMVFNEATREMLFPNLNDRCPVRAGQWIVMKETKNRGSGKHGRHCRVLDTTFWPTVKVGPFGKFSRLPLFLGVNCITPHHHCGVSPYGMLQYVMF
jgi:ubiquitin-conjugating enzyme E2 Q